MKRAAAMILLLLCGGARPHAGEKSLGTVKDFSLADVRGRPHTTSAWKDKKAVVLLFLGTECPVSNGYSPEYRRLAEVYARKGTLFYGVHPDPDVSADIAAKHAADFRLAFPILLDPTQAVAKQAGVKVVPEAVLLSAKGQILYRGRIDDLYTVDGRRREEPKSRDLEEALKAVLAGKSPLVAETRAFGCPLPLPVKAGNHK